MSARRQGAQSAVIRDQATNAIRIGLIDAFSPLEP